MKPMKSALMIASLFLGASAVLSQQLAWLRLYNNYDIKGG